MTVTVAATDVNALRARVDEALAAFFDRQDQRRPDGAPLDLVSTLHRFVLTGGKRLRPLFCYWGWRCAGGADGPPIVAAAAALELFHAFALIHDDILDGSDHRRGRPSVHRTFAELHARSGWAGDPEAYGRNAALLCGDLCAAWADEMFHECGLGADAVHRGRSVFAAMRAEAIAGEYLDLGSRNGDSSLAGALTVIRMKGARYTVTRPLQIGAALAGAAPELITALFEFGDPLGEAFQLRDDVLGVFGDPALTGKSVVDDLREGKPTVLMALVRDAADRGQSARLRHLFGNPALNAEGAAELREIIENTGAREKIEQMIRVRADTARAVLAAAPMAAESRVALAELIDRAVRRRR
ncbi:polyprenyl synthetase family protein [Actinoplanes sp. NPDC024001]|uniref:polyprenyl synthetase family protein n=1 Tax=Actinoplanes sp. NPDC024001 TaxID=3154598 RepID=UPI00340AA14E